ncbi:hypothetical protein HAX54_030969 [Datura stramonium]|uniref:Major facilitator superfamily (MFS) profile domain-containing protein n=1 Tax=Datura stramonium TaxID=4076 RepID=A0ABS8VAT9_DATST|nr:hypothetical protein [Datura stramonium]
MADSTPLLSNSPSTKNHQDQEFPKLNDHSSLEEIIEPLFGSCGIAWPQILQVILVSLACFFEAQQTFITIFTDAIPSWHCTQISTNTSCNSKSNVCQLSSKEWTWDKPIYTSIVSEWSLHCSESPILQGLPASSFFMGCLLGGLVLGLLGDTIGRKTMLFFGCLIMSMASIFIAFSDNIWMYSALRFLSGYGRAAIGSSVLVLSSESVAKQYQGKVGTIGFFMSTLGFVSLPGLAYINRNYSWRVLYLWTSLPAVVYCMLLQFCVYESPRWLLSKGEVREASAVLNTFIAPYFKNQSLNLDHKKLNITSRGSDPPLIKILLRKRWILRQLLLVLAAGFGIGLMYYGMPLGLGNGNFSLNLYLSTELNALLELPAFLIVFFLVEKCKRRSTLVGLSILSGVCGMLCMMAGERKVLQLVLELTSFFSACTAFDLLLIYTSELFPTSIRNATVSIVWQAVVLGGVVSPVLVDAGGDNSNKILPYMVLGIMTSIAGSLVIFLPETKGLEIPKNIQEQEQKGVEPPYVMNGV